MQNSKSKSVNTDDAVFDVVLANGRVIDPETYTDGIFNVGISSDKITAISTETFTVGRRK